MRKTALLLTHGLATISAEPRPVNGRFVMDGLMPYDFRARCEPTCEVALESNRARSAVWVMMVCSGRTLIVGSGDADRREENER